MNMPTKLPDTPITWLLNSLGGGEPGVLLKTRPPDDALISSTSRVLLSLEMGPMTSPVGSVAVCGTSPQWPADSILGPPKLTAKPVEQPPPVLALRHAPPPHHGGESFQRVSRAGRTPASTETGT